MLVGPVSVANGLPATGVSAPVVALIEYAETLPGASNDVFATYANSPVGSMVTATPPLAPANGLPTTGASAPLPSIA